MVNDRIDAYIILYDEENISKKYILSYQFLDVVKKPVEEVEEQKEVEEEVEEEQKEVEEEEEEEVEEEEEEEKEMWHNVVCFELLCSLVLCEDTSVHLQARVFVLYISFKRL